MALTLHSERKFPSTRKYRVSCWGAGRGQGGDDARNHGMALLLVGETVNEYVQGFKAKVQRQVLSRGLIYKNTDIEGQEL